MWTDLSDRTKNALDKVHWALNEVLQDLGVLGYPQATFNSAPYRNEYGVRWDGEEWDGAMLDALDKVLTHKPRTKAALFAALRS